MTSSRARRRAWRLSIAIAVAMHGAAALRLATLRARRPTAVVVSAPTSDTLVEASILESEGPAVLRRMDEGPLLAARAIARERIEEQGRPPRSDDDRGAPRESAPSGPSPEGPGSVPGATPLEAEANDSEQGGWTLSTSAPGSALGLGASGARLAAASAASAARLRGGGGDGDGDGDGPISRSGGVVETLDSSDVSRGFGRGGAIRSAIGRVIEMAPTPVDGRVSFAVTIARTGEITVALVAAKSDREAWERVVEPIRLALSLQARTVRIPPGAKGLRVVVDVDAHEQFVDGSRPSALGTRVESSGLEIEETKTQIVFKKLPSITLSARGKVCGAGLSVGLTGVNIAGGCSPENIGSVPIRTVSARVVEESRF